MGFLAGFLHGRIGWTGSFALPRVSKLTILDVLLLDSILLLLTVLLLFQQLQTEIPQGIGAQAAALEPTVAGNARVALQQLRNMAEGIVGQAVNIQRLE
jgi:hypothetical protein